MVMFHRDGFRLARKVRRLCKACFDMSHHYFLSTSPHSLRMPHETDFGGVVVHIAMNM